MVNIYKPKLTNLQQGILRLLFVKPGTSLTRRGISRFRDVRQPAVIKALPLLEEERLINLRQDKESKRWSIELNRENHKVLQLKRADNMKLIYESGLADFLGREFAGAIIILFGSYSRGEDTINSDIDIAVIGRKKKRFDVSKFEAVLEKSININFYDSLNKIHKNLRENIFNGIVLYGGVEL